MKRYTSKYIGFKITLFVFLIILPFTNWAQDLTGSTWDLGSTTPNSGYHNWGSGVLSLTDTTTGSGTCQGSAVIETSGYNPATNFSKCFRVFFGCPGNDQIGTSGNPYTDQNGDGMAFSFWKNNATFNSNNGNTCGGGLGYDNALTGGDNDGKMISIEFDTYSSIGTSTVDGCYGGGGPGSGINDEISLHKDMNSNDLGLIESCPGTSGTVNAGNLEDGAEHDVCISYNATTHVLTVTLDGVTKISYDLGATYNLNTYFGGKTLNYSWSAGKYGANNLQTVAPAGSHIFATMGHNPCTGAVVMPVNLIKFSGEMINSSVVLNWTTATETNNKKFIIERSGNAYSWEAIGEANGGGTMTTLSNYSFTDYTFPEGEIYYRLKQVDIDGTVSYSKLIVLQTNPHQTSIVPNPFDDVLTVKSSVKGNLDVKIYDVLGRILYQENLSSENGTVTLKPDLPKGAYVITVQTESFIDQKRIIKK